jgi:hypothetical protein
MSTSIITCGDTVAAFGFTHACDLPMDQKEG